METTTNTNEQSTYQPSFFEIEGFTTEEEFIFCTAGHGEVSEEFLIDISSNEF